MAALALGRQMYRHSKRGLSLPRRRHANLCGRRYRLHSECQGYYTWFTYSTTYKIEKKKALSPGITIQADSDITIKRVQNGKGET